MKNKDIIFEEDLNKHNKYPMFDECDYVQENNTKVMNNPFLEFCDDNNRSLYTIEDYGLTYKKKKIYIGSFIRNEYIKTKEKIKVFKKYLKKQKKDFNKNVKSIQKDKAVTNDIFENIDISKRKTSNIFIWMLCLVMNTIIIILVKSAFNNKFINSVSITLINKFNNQTWFKIIDIVSIISITVLFLEYIIYKIINGKIMYLKKNYNKDFMKNLNNIKKCFKNEYKKIIRFYSKKILRKEKYYEALSLDTIWSNERTLKQFDNKKNEAETKTIDYKKFIKYDNVINTLFLIISILTSITLLISVIICSLLNI